MKKLFAALLAISITAALAGCSKPADEQIIDDITEETSVVTEAAETFSETETTAETESASDPVSETEEMMAETSTTTETSSETEKATTATSFECISETKSYDEPRLAQHEDLIGCWRILEYQTTLIFDENRYIGLDTGWGEIVNDTVKDGMLKFSERTSDLTATICGDKLFVEEKEEDGETYLYEFERYTQPDV
ncbi:MAG: hypothetical protein K2K44_01120, partial [Oscillospiraceae bacterium]|nr:hypothetical protein [Oscillospiraceae bacterium]